MNRQLSVSVFTILQEIILK